MLVIVSNTARMARTERCYDYRATGPLSRPVASLRKARRVLQVACSHFNEIIAGHIKGVEILVAQAAVVVGERWRRPEWPVWRSVRYGRGWIARNFSQFSGNGCGFVRLHARQRSSQALAHSPRCLRPPGFPAGLTLYQLSQPQPERESLVKEGSGGTGYSPLKQARQNCSAGRPVASTRPSKLR